MPSIASAAVSVDLPRPAGPQNSTAFPSSTTAGALYTVQYNFGTFMQVRVVHSTNGGTTWSAPVVVRSASTHDQFLPWLSVSDTGAVGVTMLDRTADPQNRLYNAVAVLSTDGGVTFGSPFTLSTVQSNPANDGFGGTFIGDYTGNIWTGTTLHASWMDTRTGVSADETGGLIQ